MLEGVFGLGFGSARQVQSAPGDAEPTDEQMEDKTRDEAGSPRDEGRIEHEVERHDTGAEEQGRGAESPGLRRMGRFAKERAEQAAGGPVEGGERPPGKHESECGDGANAEKSNPTPGSQPGGGEDAAGLKMERGKVGKLDGTEQGFDPERSLREGELEIGGDAWDGSWVQLHGDAEKRVFREHPGFGGGPAKRAGVEFERIWQRACSGLEDWKPGGFQEKAEARGGKDGHEPLGAPEQSKVRGREMADGFSAPRQAKDGLGFRARGFHEWRECSEWAWRVNLAG